jgi:YVTN family beta-propeller protein
LHGFLATALLLHFYVQVYTFLQLQDETEKIVIANLSFFLYNDHYKQTISFSYHMMQNSEQLTEIQMEYQSTVNVSIPENEPEALAVEVENRAVEGREKVEEQHMEAAEADKRLMDCAAEQWQQVCTKIVTTAMAVATIAQSEITQWLPRVEAMDKYTEAEMVEVVSQAKEWLARVQQAVERVQKQSHTESEPISIADMIQPISQDITAVVDGVRQFITAVHICQAKVEAIQAEHAAKEAQANVDRAETEASNVKIEAKAYKTAAGERARAKKKEAVKAARAEAERRSNEAEEAKIAIHHAVEAAKRGEFPLEAAKETKAAVIEAKRKWKMVVEQLHKTWNNVVRVAVNVATIFQSKAHAWILKAEKIVKPADEKMAEITVQTEAQIKQDFAQVNEWVEGIEKQSLQTKSRMGSDFISIAEVAKTIIQDTVKVITGAKRIIAKVEMVQAMIAAGKVEADARKAEAEAIVAKIEYRAVMATEMKKKEEAAAKAVEKKKLARVVREEAGKRASAVKEAEEKAKLVEVEERVKLIEVEVAELKLPPPIVIDDLHPPIVADGSSEEEGEGERVEETIEAGKEAEEKEKFRKVEVAYVVNTGSDSVSLIDTDTQKVVATIPVGQFPYGVAVTSDGSRVYVVNRDSDNVSVIDTATQKVVATIPVGRRPVRVAITPNGSWAYVGNGGSNNVSVIDTATQKVVATIPIVGRSYPNVVGSNCPYYVAITPDGSRVYVVSKSGNSSGIDTANVNVIDTATQKVVAAILVEEDPRHCVAFTSDGSRAYAVGDRWGRDSIVEVIDTATQKVVATIPVRVPQHVALTPDGSRAYVVSWDSVTVIDTDTQKVVGTIPVGGSIGAIVIASIPTG